MLEWLLECIFGTVPWRYQLYQKKSPKKISFRNTKNVNKRNNPKLCLICNKPYINVTCHNKGQHTISSIDLEYRRLIEEAEVVPKRFTNKVGQ